MRSISGKLLYIFLSLNLMMLLTGTQPARAAGAITVNTDTDIISLDGICSLREAITAANTDTASGATSGECAAGSGTDVITFDANYTITLGSQLPAVITEMTITGNGAANTIIQANADPNVVNYRLFAVNLGGNLTLDQLKVQNGRTPFGGGILNSGTLSITNSVFSNNIADNNGGHIHNSGTGTVFIENTTISGDAAIRSDAGGAVFNDGGTVTVTSSTIQDNYTNNAGAGFYNDGTITIINSTITGNHATGNIGGGIYNANTTHIYNSTLSGNAGTTGDNIYNNSLSVLNLYNTIVANGGLSGDCVNAGTVNSTNSLIESTGVNACGLIDEVDGNVIGIDPGLGALTDSPAYFPLNVLSPAIDAGDNTICAAAPVSNISQNGGIRPQNGDGNSSAVCDIGSYEVPDTITPTVTSSVRASTNPTNAASVNFTVTFSESVTGVDETDFSLTASGVSSPAVSGISGSGRVYTVSVDTGTGNGTIRLDVLDDNSIKDNVDNLLSAGFTSGETYTVEKTAPTVTSSVRASANPTGASSVNYTVTFSESVTGVNTADFSLTTTGVSSAAVSGVSGSGSVYTVSVNTGTDSGTLRLDVLDDDSIVDATLNPLTTGFTTGESYTVTKSPVFEDVPFSNPFNSFIERLFNAGVTGGCSITPLNYCPDNTVTRAQMAVFLLKSIHGSSYVPPAVGASTGFGDVPVDAFAAAFIKQLAVEGVTSGCGNGNYCPDATVTRAQMAIFLLKAKNGSSYTPPAVGVSTGFNDVATDAFAAAFIKQLVADGITAGCGNSNYCPNDSVTRAQMAVFLVRAFNLP
ncbi:MAG: S-layer homology domain-containing protein [Anaerolineales bacterium]|nr:S-layer homology domain-containing protein [Anaerolineales bacterium]